MSTPPDRGQLRRELSDALSALQRTQDVTGLDALAASLTPLGPTYAFHRRLLLRTLEGKPPRHSALIWNFQVLDKPERSVS